MDCFIFYARYPHWFSLAISVKGYLEDKGSRVIIVTPGRFIYILRQLGLKDGYDFIAATELEEKIDQFENTECHVILHHSNIGVEAYRRFFDPFFRTIGQSPRVCFYTDGYTNRYLDSTKVDKFLKDTPSIQLESVFYFDIDGSPEERWPKRKVNAYRVPSRYLAAYAESPIAREVAGQEFERLRKRTKTQDILLVLLRPLGSQTFHRGAFALDEGANQAVDLYKSFISAAVEGIGREVTVFVRPDNRDAEYSSLLISAIRKRVKDTPVEVSGIDWPDWMTFEPILFFAQRELAPCRVHVAAVDSTASLPFLQMRLIDSIFVGLPIDEATSTLLDQPGMDFFMRKIRFLRGQIEKLDLLDINVEEISKNLFWVCNK